MAETIEISIVSPVYKAENIIDDLVLRLKETLKTLNVIYEIILVDDRSPDGSWKKMKQLSKTHPEVKSIRLSRNFGQHPAIMAGLSQAKGNWIVVMDCDLQDQPKEITQLYTKAQEGFDVVLAKRTKRRDSFLKKYTSKLFYIFFNYFSGISIDNEIANFGMYHKKVIKDVLQIGDKISFFPLFVNWVGYKQTAITVEHAERIEGQSSYSYLKLFKLAFNTIISFSDRPLRLFLNFGILVSTLSFLAAIYVFFQAIFNKIEVMGYASIFIGICFFSGIIITILGITGIYLGKVFNQVKNRPLYIVDELHD
jgi:glycosyltransferase involved in cell wall biosynthesis